MTIINTLVRKLESTNEIDELNAKIKDLEELAQADRIHLKDATFKLQGKVNKEIRECLSLLSEVETGLFNRTPPKLEVAESYLEIIRGGLNKLIVNE